MWRIKKYKWYFAGVLCLTALLSFTLIKGKKEKKTNKWIPVSAMEADKRILRQAKNMLK